MAKLIDGNRIIDTRFFGAGNSIFTIYSPSRHYTFKIRQRRVKAHERNAQGNPLKQEKMPFYVYLLTGQENTSDYTYIGVYNPRYNSFHLTKSSKFNDETKAVKVLRWGLRMVADGDWSSPNVQGYGVISEGRCCKCGRTLTAPESISDGIGAKCAGSI